jgi:hypothetical protein
MNNAFTKKKKIELGFNWSLSSDGYNGVVLTFAEQGQKEKVIIEKGKKKVHTGVFEPFLFEDKFYFPRVAQALEHYSDNVMNDCSSLEELAEKCNAVTEMISKLDKEFKQF